MCKLFLRCVIVKKKFEIIVSNNNVEKKLINKVIKFIYVFIFFVYMVLVLDYFYWNKCRIKMNL